METEWLQLIQTLAGAVVGLGAGVWSKSGKIKAQADAYKAMADAYEFRIESMNKQIAVYDDMERKHAQRISQLNKDLDDKEQYHTEREDKLQADLRVIRESTANEINTLHSQLIDAKELEIELTHHNCSLELELARKKCEDLKCPWRKPPTPDTPPIPNVDNDLYHRKQLFQNKNIPDHGNN